MRPSGNPVRPVTSWLRARPLVADSLLAAAIAVTNVAGLASWETFEGAPGATPPDLLAYVLVVLFAAPLAWRRRAPLAVLAATFATLVVYLLLDYPEASLGLSNLVALYTVGAHCERRRSRAGFGAAIALIVAMMAIGWLTEDELPAIGVISNLALFSGAWLLGDNLQTRRAYLAGLEENVANAERERRAESLRAVQEERIRIARELHDVVAHGMSVMVVQASGAQRMLGSDTEVSDRRSVVRTREALTNIETTGREALGEMRRLLGIVRDESDDAEMAPQPGLDDIDDLVARWSDAGLRVDLHRRGDPDGVTAGVGLTAYRVVQEALTNVSRHAGPGATAEVAVDVSDDIVQIVVADDGRGAAAVADTGPDADEPAVGSGHGLVGMRERVGLYGGSVAAGPRNGGGYEVRVRIPVS